MTHVNPIAAIFNPAWATETSHVVVGAYLAKAFGIASVYAVGMLRGRRDSYHRKAIAVGLSMAAILAPLQVAVGDLLGRTVADHQPATLAAIEGITHTERGAGLNVGGFRCPATTATYHLNIKVPHLLSLLAFDNPNATVRGLDTFPKADRTGLAAYVRIAFIGMVGIGTGLVALSLLYWLGGAGYRPARGPSHPDGARGSRSGGIPGQRARVARRRTRTPAVDRLRSLPNLERDHDRARGSARPSPPSRCSTSGGRAHRLDRATYHRNADRRPPRVSRWRVGLNEPFPQLLALALGLSLTAYAVFAGADFGAGVLDLLAGKRELRP